MEAASEQSSMICERIAPSPPLRANAEGRTSMHPPAAPAVVAPVAGDPERWIQLQEEEYKSRNQPTLRRIADGEQDHRRQQVGIQPPGISDQPRDIVRFVMNIRIGE